MNNLANLPQSKKEIPDRKKLLFKPENELLLEKLKRGIEDGESTDLGSFRKFWKRP